MFCPSCLSEYRPGFYRCSDCDVDLVEKLPTRQKDLDIVKIFETHDRALAHIVETILRSQRIEFLTNYGNTDVSAVGLAPMQFWVAGRNARAALEAIATLVDASSPLEGPKARRSIHITHYSRRTGQARSEGIKEPSWSIVEQEIRTMEPFAKPIVFLLTSNDNTETSYMTITGGYGVYHVQIADEDGAWQAAVNPSRGSREIEVWTSDQGLTTQERFTWDTDEAVRIAKSFWQEQKPSPDVQWN